MPKNRDYTGLVRTPSSMAWLIRKRSLDKGQIDKLAKAQAEIPDEIQPLQEELEARDAVIPLHEVPVDPTVILGTKPKGQALSQYGNLTRFLLERLREAEGKWLYTSELAAEFASLNGVDLQVIKLPEVTNRVAKRLGVLERQGDVRRDHDRATQELGRWSLVLVDRAALWAGLPARVTPAHMHEVRVHALVAHLLDRVERQIASSR
jgi:hypothetical protein